MKSKTEKVLIHISTTYTPKNKLQSIALEKLNTLNYILCDSLTHAKSLLMEQLRDAHGDCKTNCRPIEFGSFKGISESTIYYISGLIRIELLPVYNLESYNSTKS